VDGAIAGAGSSLGVMNSGADFQQWCREAGFQRFEIIRLAGPSSAAIAYK
jgi:hypothetical protein